MLLFCWDVSLETTRAPFLHFQSSGKGKAGCVFELPSRLIMSWKPEPSRCWSNWQICVRRTLTACLSFCLGQASADLNCGNLLPFSKEWECSSTRWFVHFPINKHVGKVFRSFSHNLIAFTSFCFCKFFLIHFFFLCQQIKTSRSEHFFIVCTENARCRWGPKEQLC